MSRLHPLSPLPLAGDPRATVPLSSQVDDQLTFNQLVEWNGSIGDARAGHVYPIRAARLDGRVLYDASRTRRIAPLPARLVCSGHVFHIQQAVERRQCLVMHLTFVEAERAGKRWRLREAGLWPYQPEALGSARFLTYTATLPNLPVPPERHPSLMRSDGGLPAPMPNKTRWPGDRQEGWSVDTALVFAPRLAAHLKLVDEHIFAMKQAIAIARVLNRQLIMPPLLCLCERAQQPWDVLPTCTKSGTSTPTLPYVSIPEPTASHPPQMIRALHKACSCIGMAQPSSSSHPRLVSSSLI